MAKRMDHCTSPWIASWRCCRNVVSTAQSMLEPPTINPLDVPIGRWTTMALNPRKRRNLRSLRQRSIQVRSVLSLGSPRWPLGQLCFLGCTGDTNLEGKREFRGITTSAIWYGSLVRTFSAPGIWAKHPKEKCQKIVKEQEFKIRKLKEKMAGIAPTKKNKDGKSSFLVIVRNLWEGKLPRGRVLLQLISSHGWKTDILKGDKSRCDRSLHCHTLEKNQQRVAGQLIQFGMILGCWGGRLTYETTHIHPGSTTGARMTLLPAHMNLSKPSCPHLQSHQEDQGNHQPTGGDRRGQGAGWRTAGGWEMLMAWWCPSNPPIGASHKMG